MRDVRLAVSVALLLTLSGCQALGSGSMRFGSDELCSSVKKGEKFVIGEVITAPESQWVTIRDVAFTGEKGVVLVSSYLLNIIGRDSLGNSPYPPAEWPSWEKRVRAEGATLSPGAQKNLVVVVERESQEPGQAGALEVTYSSVSGQTRKAGSTRYAFMDSCP